MVNSRYGQLNAHSNHLSRRHNKHSLLLKKKKNTRSLIKIYLVERLPNKSLLYQAKQSCFSSPLSNLWHSVERRVEIMVLEKGQKREQGAALTPAYTLSAMLGALPARSALKRS